MCIYPRAAARRALPGLLVLPPPPFFARPARTPPGEGPLPRPFPRPPPPPPRPRPRPVRRTVVLCTHVSQGTALPHCSTGSVGKTFPKQAHRIIQEHCVTGDLQHHTSALRSAGAEALHVGGRSGIVALPRTLAAAKAVLAVLGIPLWVAPAPPAWNQWAARFRGCCRAVGEDHGKGHSGASTQAATQAAQRGEGRGAKTRKRATCSGAPAPPPAASAAAAAFQHGIQVQLPLVAAAVRMADIRTNVGNWGNARLQCRC